MRRIGPALTLALWACGSGQTGMHGAAGSSARGADSPTSAGATASRAAGRSGGFPDMGVDAAGDSGTAAMSGGAGTAIAGASGASASVPAPPVCTSPIGSCPAHSIGIWQELLNAADFGAGSRLVATGGLGVLVALGDGSFRVARLADPNQATSSTAPYAAWDFSKATPQAQPIGIMEGRLSHVVPEPPDMMLVLTCGEAGTRCSLWRSDIQADQPSPWQEQPLPPSFIARGVTFDLAVEPGQICVYGSGLYCWNDSWQQAIPESPELRLNAVAIGPLWSLVVGDHGRWWKRVRDDSGALGPWQEQARLSDVALSQVSVVADGAAIVGEGRLQALLGTQAKLYDCLVTDDVAAFVLDPAIQGLAYLVTNSGHIFQHAPTSARRAEAYCDYQQLPLTGPVIQSGAVPCSAANNPRLLTELVLFGQTGCLTI